MAQESSLVSFNHNGSSLMDSRRNDSGVLHTDEDLLDVFKTILNVLRNRNVFMSAKCKQSFNLSRSIAGATMIENDNNCILMEYYQDYKLRAVYEDIFNLSVNSSLIWDILKQCLPILYPGEFPKPVSHAKILQRNKQFVPLMYNVGLKAVEYTEVEKKYSQETRDLFIAKIHYLETIKQFQALKERKRLDEPSAQKGKKKEHLDLMKKRKMISSINKMNLICANLIAHYPALNLEDPKTFEMISESRNILTQHSLRTEAKRIYQNLSEMSGH